MAVPPSQRIPISLGPPVSGTRSQLVRVIRNLEIECRTREQADAVADMLASLLPDPVGARFGLVELLLNSIEHGNLEIGGEHKYQLLRECRFDDEVAARLEREPYRSRRVHITVTAAFPAIEIEIRDDGPGFDWRSALAADLVCHDGPGGRGIAIISRVCFPHLEYRDPGNVAVIRVSWPAS